jgi:AbrB family looped-hinge helix DNA binding protein
MDVAARVTSKGQVTVPKAVREALGVNEGDALIFRIEGNRAVIARTPDFLELAGQLRIPVSKKSAAWDHVISSTRTNRAAKNR